MQKKDGKAKRKLVEENGEGMNLNEKPIKAVL